ncbi:MAG: 3-dehydroquinate synthase [candidate division Zixibacteria bacterium]|nr:3-dehydroquinate synthase [candidate division Zixibacteria bacterium]
MSGGSKSKLRRLQPVVVGRSHIDRLIGLLAKHAGTRRVFVIIDERFDRLHGGELVRRLTRVGYRCPVGTFRATERSKSQRSVTRIHDFFLENEISRDDFVLACGGGITTDLAGYAASTILRGVAWGAVPTTLLGMVDAAIEGKTGVNHARGKNLVGTFWQPAFVWSNLDYLETLPDRHLRGGLGEIAKCAGLAGGRLLDRLEKYLDLNDLKDLRYLDALVRMTAEFKAQVVAADELERGRRMILNFGHTFGHGIELAAGYGRLQHGEAVTLGLLAALNLRPRAEKAGDTRERYRKLIESLVVRLPKYRIDVSRVLQAMKLDKKRRGRNLRFVLIDRPGKPIISEDMENAQARGALERALDVYECHGGKRARRSGR